PYLPSSYSVAGDDVERLKMYSDLFEEVIERDRVFGSLLRKVKSAYDSMLQSKAMAPMPSVPPMPAPDTGPGSLGRYSESTREGPETWELYQENRALKDLVERLHMELEQAVKREQRWRSKASKLKGKERRSERARSLADLKEPSAGSMNSAPNEPIYLCSVGQPLLTAKE
ncbi:unnamed protein product, partial [Effrenium voratum]